MTEQLLDLGPRRGGHEEVRADLGAERRRAGARGDGCRGADPGAVAVWHDGAACLVGDGPWSSSRCPGSSTGDALVVVRSKDKGGRLAAWTAKVVELAPGSPAWEVTVAELKGKRLNAPDEEMPARGPASAGCCAWSPWGGHPPAAGGLAAPVPSPATTRQPIPAAVPRLLFRKRTPPPAPVRRTGPGLRRRQLLAVVHGLVLGGLREAKFLPQSVRLSVPASPARTRSSGYGVPFRETSRVARALVAGDTDGADAGLLVVAVRGEGTVRVSRPSSRTSLSVKLMKRL